MLCKIVVLIGIMYAHNELSIILFNKSAMRKIWAETALTPQGWKDSVAIFDRVRRPNFQCRGWREAPENERYSVVLPAPCNLHSHAFQRAMAGLTEFRSPAGRDDFWSWRQFMYRFLGGLNPDDIEAISAFAQLEMLEAGFACVGEFHYLHRAQGGGRYANLAEMSLRIVSAADRSGIGLTLLPVLYEQGGCDGRELVSGQVRFCCDIRDAVKDT